jgi:UDP-GlcNAc3NAcA epimerase
MALNILTVIGARPQFVKAAAFSRWVREHGQGRIVEKIIHTGQHYDDNMSDVFFRDLDIPAPAYRFQVAGSTHGRMTGTMITEIEEVLMQEKPDCVLVYGDTNSTLAGAIAAVKLHIPIAHVEAGLRSANRKMPEEINRIVADQLAARLYCPSENAMRNLLREGISGGVLNVGDIMYDVALYYRNAAMERSNALSRFGVEPGNYVVSTIHRAENTDMPERLREICKGIGLVSEKVPVILPLHPRTRKIVLQQDLMPLLGSAIVTDPLSLIDFIRLQISAQVILTDSGGVQKEAYFYEVPCVTVRDQTEWTETIEAGWNRLTVPEALTIADITLKVEKPADPKRGIYGKGDTAQQIGEDLAVAFG